MYNYSARGFFTLARETKTRFEQNDSWTLEVFVEPLKVSKVNTYSLGLPMGVNGQAAQVVYFKLFRFSRTPRLLGFTLNDHSFLLKLL